MTICNSHIGIKLAYLHYIYMKYLTIILIIIFVFGAGYYFINRNADKNINKENKIMEPKILQWAEAPAMQIDADKNYEAVIKTSEGDMAFELFVGETPATANNFVFLAQQGFYDGVKFHRIIKDFMIQGGDPRGNGTGDPGYKFNDEPITRDYERGILAMANSGPNTNGSQFFIMHKNYPLPKNYVIFGRLANGFDVLDKIAETSVAPNYFGELSLPVKNVVINSVEIIEK